MENNNKITDLTLDEFCTIVNAFRRSSEYLKMIFTDTQFEEYVANEIAGETKVLNLLCKMRYGVEGYGS